MKKFFSLENLVTFLTTAINSKLLVDLDQYIEWHGHILCGDKP